MKWLLLLASLAALLCVCAARAPVKVDALLPAHYDLRQAYPRCILPVFEAGQWFGGTTSSSPDETNDPAALLEGLYTMSVTSCIQSGRAVHLSLAYVRSCCAKCDQCEGSDLLTIFNFLKNNGSVNASCITGPSSSCPTKCVDGSPIVPVRAQFSPVKGVAQVQQTIATTGPVMALVNGEALEMYTGGVLTCKGASLELDHVVSIIGWGIENNIPYWIAQNNWGPDWGENGYFRIERGIDACGIELVNFAPKLI